MSFTIITWLHLIIFLSFLFSSIESQSIIKTLPGYPGPLPFKLATGYVDVGKSDEIKLFYYFIESERNPQDDPLVLWLSGGPGCSGFTGLAFEIGPIDFDASSFSGSLPSLILREYSWTKIASIIFIDSPVGTGFSYATETKSYLTSDSLSAKDTYTFMRKWLLSHPIFIKNRLYIGGDSYGGKMVPLVAFEISKGNKEGHEPEMSLQGYLVGNPVADPISNENEKIPYAHGMALISNEYYELAKSSCSGEYVNPDPNNAQCNRALELINECLENINEYHILAPSCKSEGQRKGQVLLEEDNWLDINLSFNHHKTICTDHVMDILTHVWGNNQDVQDALHVRKGNIKEWKRCCGVISGYEKDVANAVPYHRLLSQKKYQAMVYSGDHDFSTPYLATLKWVQQLNLTIVDRWRPWNVNRQVAGYTQSYKKNDFHLTFATVKGASHTAAGSKPEECLAMVDRFFSHKPL